MLPQILLDSAAPIATRSGKMEVSMVEIQPIRVEIEREEDGRILASVPDLPGVMAYGGAGDEAVRKVKSTLLRLGWTLKKLVGPHRKLQHPRVVALHLLLP